MWLLGWRGLLLGWVLFLLYALACMRLQARAHIRHRLPRPTCPPAERAAALVQGATQAGALAFLQAGVLDSVPMQARWRGWAAELGRAGLGCGSWVRRA